jgi:transposase-like protein
LDLLSLVRQYIPNQIVSPLDTFREVHVNTIEGLWTSVLNFLRPFRGVHKRNLGQYAAICEFSINTKKVTPKFISALVALH